MACAELMAKSLVVELAFAFTIVDGLTDNNHGGEGEMMALDNLGKVFQHATEDTLLLPGEFMTDRHGSVLGIAL